MPPVKKAPTPKLDTPNTATLLLFLQNMDEMARYCRRSSHPGAEVGHIVMQEITLAALSTALTFAIEGRQWTPPQQ